MTTTPLDWIADSALGRYMAESPTAFPIAEMVHVLAIATVIGVIAIVDLRLIGWASTGYRVSRLTRTLLPITWAGFAIAVLSGVLMFSSQPHVYFDNLAFRLKLLALLGAGLNMLAFHFLTWRAIDAWDDAPAGPVAVRAAGAISLALWVLVVFLGRWIGFTMDPF